jgi:hypothetical protein
VCLALSLTIPQIRSALYVRYLMLRLSLTHDASFLHQTAQDLARQGDAAACSTTTLLKAMDRTNCVNSLTEHCAELISHDAIEVRIIELQNADAQAGVWANPVKGHALYHLKQMAHGAMQADAVRIRAAVTPFLQDQDPWQRMESRNVINVLDGKPESG